MKSNKSSDLGGGKSSSSSSSAATGAGETKSIRRRTGAPIGGSSNTTSSTNNTTQVSSSSSDKTKSSSSSSRSQKGSEKEGSNTPTIKEKTKEISKELKSESKSERLESSSSSSLRGSNTPPTLLPPPPNTEKCTPFYPITLFQEKSAFGDNYNEGEFMETLTYKLLNEVNRINSSNSSNGFGSNSANQELEDKQADYLEVFQQLFHRSIVDMERLMKDVNITVEKLVKETEAASQKHQSKLQTFHQELETISEKFKNIEDVINQVGNTTVQIGNTLDTVDKQKSRAIEAKQLMRFFNEFNGYDPEKFKTEILPKKKFAHAIFKKKGSQHRAAKIVQELSLIAADLTKVDSCKNAIANIKLYNDDLLHNLLEDFAQSVKLSEDQRKQGISEMKKKARILLDIKNESKCIDLYVKMRFEKFINFTTEGVEKQLKENFGSLLKDIKELETKLETKKPSKSNSSSVVAEDENEDEDDGEERGTTTDISQNNTGTDKSHDSNTADDTESMENTLDTYKQQLEEARLNTRDIVYQECLNAVIKSANDVEAFTNFLTRVEKATSSEYSIISEVFSNSSRDVLLLFLQKIVDEILEEIVSALLKDPSEEDRLESYLKNFEKIYNTTINFVDRLVTEHSNIPTLKSNLTRSIENIFFVKKKGYGSVEKKYIEAKYEDIVLPIEEMETPILQLLATSQKVVLSGSNLPQIFSNAMLVPEQFEMLKDYPRLQLDVIVNFIHTNTESLLRCKKLSLKNEIPKNMYTIFELLKNAVCSYAKKGLEFSVATIAFGSKKEPSTDLYLAIHLTNSVLQKVQRHLEQNILPSIVSVSLPMQLQCIKLKDDLFTTLEAFVVKGLETMLKSIVEYCKFILEKEQKNIASDYKPKENDSRFVYVEHQPTLGCTKCCSFLTTHCEQIQTCLFGKNREYFLTKLGMHFFQLLTNTLKDMSVSNLGAIKLMRDLSEYQKCMRQFQVTVIEDQFDTLREVSNVLLVLPQNLPEVVSQLEKNPSVKHEDVITFIRMRSDYSKNKAMFKEKIPDFH